MATKKKTEVQLKFEANTSEFNTSIKQMNSDIKLLNNQLKLNSTQLKGNSSNVDLLKERQNLLTVELQKQTQKVSDTNNKLEEAKKLFGEDSQEVRNLTNDLLKAQTQQEATRNELNGINQKIEEVTTSLEKNSSELKQNGQNYEELKKIVSKQKEELTTLKNEYKNVVLEQGKNSSEAKNLKEKINSLNLELGKNEQQLKAVDSAAENTANGGYTVFKGVLTNLVTGVLKSGIEMLKDLASNTIEVGKTFDASMSQVSAVSGATGKDLELLREKAKQMGASTKFTASEAADAFNYMAMAGWKTEDMLNGIDGILSLAAASNSDLATTSDIVTDALTGMGYSAADAGKLADVMAMASSNANTNVEMMGETFKYVAPVIGALGFSMEDASVAIGLMANSGIKASQAGTSLRSILTRLAAPPDTAAGSMQKLGISITNTDGSMKSLSEIMQILREKFSGLTEAEQAQHAKNIAGQEAMSGLLSIVNASSSDFEKLTNAVNNSSGAAEQMSKTMQDNLSGDLTALGSKFEGVQIAVYEKFEPALRSGVDVLSGLLDKIDWVVDHSNELIGVLKVMGVSIGSYLGYITAIQVMKNGWMSLSIVQKSVAATQRLVNLAMSANPIGILIAVIAGLVVAFISLWNNCESFRNFWIGLWNDAVSFFIISKNKVVDGFNNIVAFVKNNWQGLLLFIVNPFAGAFKLLYDNCDSFRNKVDDLKSKIVGIFSGIANTLKNIFHFNIDLPKMKMPHFSITPRGWKIGDLMKGKIPKLGVDWYAKGAVFTKPTIFNTSSGYKGVAEAGSETILPLSVLDDKIQTSMAKVLGNFGVNLDSLGFNSIIQSTTSDITNIRLDKVCYFLEKIADKNYSLYVDGTELARTTANATDEISGELIELKDRGLEL